MERLMIQLRNGHWLPGILIAAMLEVRLASGKVKLYSQDNVLDVRPENVSDTNQIDEAEEVSSDITRKEGNMFHFLTSRPLTRDELGELADELPRHGGPFMKMEGQGGNTKTPGQTSQYKANYQRAQGPGGAF